MYFDECDVSYVARKFGVSDKKAKEFVSKMGKNMVLKIKNSEKT